MRKSYFVLGLLLLAVFLGGIATPGFSQITSHTTCPVMPGERVKEKFYVDYHGKRIHLCCRNCVIAFKKRPQKYLKNLKEE